MLLSGPSVIVGLGKGAIDNLMGTNGQPPFCSKDPTLDDRAIRDGKLLQQALTAGLYDATNALKVELNMSDVMIFFPTGLPKNESPHFERPRDGRGHQVRPGDG